MAFKIHKVDDGHNLPYEYLPCSAITPKIGLALVQTGGNLTLCSATATPTYISMIEKNAACAAGDIIPVVRVEKDVIWETEATAAMTAVTIGSKVTLSADGMGVTATTTSGVAEVVDMDGTAIGDKVYVRF